MPPDRRPSEFPRRRVLALVLAGGEGGRLDVLTSERAKPALPFAGVYRLIDFPLSNCAHSGIRDVWVLQQYQPHALSNHLAGGRPWDLDGSHEGLRVLQPYLGRSESGWYRGNADAIYRNKTEIQAFDPDLLLVLSADQVYKLDYSRVITLHLDREADVTIVTTEVPRAEAGRFGTVDVDEGRVVDFAYKPDQPQTGLVTAEVFVYAARTLLEALDELARESGADRDEEASLDDFGDALLPRLVQRGSAYEYRLEGYWRDVGTVESYWQAHMELLEREPAVELDEPEWPIRTFGPQRPPARIDAPADVVASLVSPGCTVLGSVERSVLAPGVVVEEGAVVRRSVLLHDVHVAAGARVECCIVDERAAVEADATVGGEGELTLVGRGARVATTARVDPGGRIEPGARAG